MGWRLGLLLLLSGAALLTAVEVVELHDTSLPDVSVSGPLANDELALIQGKAPRMLACRQAFLCR